MKRLLFSCAWLALAGCIDRSAPVANPDDSVVLERITPTAPQIAHYSSLAKPERLLVRDAQTFADVWARAFGPDVPVPNVDFAQERVIVAALGQRASGGYGIEVKSAVVEGGELVVDVTSTSPGRDCVVSLAITHPVDMVKVRIRAGSARFREQSLVKDCSGP
jgi:hypothetical protein